MLGLGLGLKEEPQSQVVLPVGFSPGQVCYGFDVTKETDSKMLFGLKGLYPTLFPGGRSVTKILFTQSESACSKPVSASGHLCPPSCPAQLSSGPLCTVVPHNHPLDLCPQCCHHSSLCSALLQPCSPATASCPECWVELFYRLKSHVLPTGVQ